MSSKKEHAGYNLMIDHVWREVKRRRRRDLQRLDVVAIVELLRDYIALDTRAGRRFPWPHFGVFRIKRVKARNIRNPKTREVMRLPAGWTLAFRASKDQKGVGNAP